MPALAKVTEKEVLVGELVPLFNELSTDVQESGESDPVYEVGACYWSREAGGEVERVEGICGSWREPTGQKHRCVCRQIPLLPGRRCVEEV